MRRPRIKGTHIGLAKLAAHLAAKGVSEDVARVRCALGRTQGGAYG
jgi:hypothetical protein